MTNHSTTPSPCQTAILSNGLRIVHRKTDVPVMFCGFMVDCGMRDEPAPELFGIAHFVEHILFKGTRTRDSWHINNRMESVGGELNAFTTKEETTFYAVGLNKDFTRACELLCDLVFHPTAPQAELEKEREVVIDEILSYRDTPAELIFDEFENLLFDGHPLGHSILGTEDTVRTFDHDRCIRFIQQHYLPSRMVFFHQGNTPFERVVKCLEKYAVADILPPEAVLTRPTSEAPHFSKLGSEPVILHYDTHQSHVLLGSPAYPIGHPKGYALTLLNNILGGPGMNSRLGLELREHRGLVYTVESTLSRYTDAGYFSIYFGCDHHDVAQCLKLCHKQLDHFRNHILSPRQLQAAQKQLCGQLGVSSANLENSSINMSKNHLRFGHVDSLEETTQRIMEITPALVNEVANEVFNKSMLKTIIIQ